MLKWMVYYEDWNGKKIEPFNVFRHGGFLNDLRKAAKKVHVREDIKEEKEWFLDQLRRSLGYYYWSKCEWELVLTPWVCREGVKDVKIDVYSQVMMNWEVFSEYVWKNRKELRKNE